jgi:hypothetical protein
MVAQQSSRAPSNLCRRSPNEETTSSEEAAHLRRTTITATHRDLQGGVFMKIMTEERYHRPIRGSWAFARSTKENQEEPQRRLQEGYVIRGRHHRVSGRPEQEFPLRQTSLTRHGARRPHDHGHRPAPEPMDRLPTNKVPTNRGRLPENQTPRAAGPQQSTEGHPRRRTPTPG